MQDIRVIDSHTGGEPTRIILDGGPDLGPGDLLTQRTRFRDEFDAVRSAVINEPRGSDVLVGGLLTKPVHPDSVCGIIFFNNTGYLNMCGHGTIGLMVTLAWLGRITPGVHRIDTPVGTVTATLHDQHRVSLTNVPSWRYRKNVTVNVEGDGSVTGDIAWGGNWFFLVQEHSYTVGPEHCRQLTDFTERIRRALQREGITGADGGEIDHIEVFTKADPVVADSRSFVLCPGGAYDRSPCGTGTSAKLACLAADGKLAAGAVWRQQSVIGSVFDGSYQPAGEPDQILPTITGTAWVTGDLRLIFDPQDPFRAGFGPV